MTGSRWSLLEIVVTALFAGLCVIVALQVVLRFVFSTPLWWTEGLARYALTWMAFLGAAVAFRRDSHVNIDVVIARLSPRARRIVQRVTECLVIVFLGIVAVKGAQLAWQTRNVLAPSFPVSRGLIVAAVPLSAALIVLTILGRWWALARRRDADPSAVRTEP